MNNRRENSRYSGRKSNFGQCWI